MFSKDNSKPGKSDGAAPEGSSFMTGSSSAVPATPSIISADLKIIGNMQSNGDIQIDGQVDGDVQSKSLTVGESAQVNGTIACERVRVCGSVSGEIKADSVVLARSAKVDGDIVHKTLEIEAGASLQGGVRRLEGAPAKKDDKPANVSKITDAKAAGSASSANNGAAAAL
jgi:cytoskeletal protein CcmA (bactofilin family)